MLKLSPVSADAVAIVVAPALPNATAGELVQPFPPVVIVTDATDEDAVAVAPLPVPENATAGDEVHPMPGDVTVTAVTAPLVTVAVPSGTVEQPPPLNVTVGAVV